MRSSRGFHIRALGLPLLAVWAPGAMAMQIDPSPLRVELVDVATELVAPVALTHANDGSGRLFITDQVGVILIVKEGALLPQPFLDVRDRIVTLHTGFDERGLLGLAFHPDYAENGRFYVRYSAPRDGERGEPCFGTDRGCHSEVLAEFMVSADPDVADADSERVLLSVEEPQFNHNAGDLAFGADGLLYFGLGDGGGAHDGLADDPPSHGPIGNGQNVETLLGSILRIDVDGGVPYGIPADNPFAMGGGAPEIYAYGFRNPFKLSFDDGPGGDGRLLVGDVGQALFEELDVVELGGNYGWVIREGFHCFDPFNPTEPPADCPDTGPFGEPLLDPLVEYNHAEGGLSIIGGYVYRGGGSPALAGSYVFGDFSASFGQPQGRLYHLVGPSSAPEIRELLVGLDGTPYGMYLKGFGEDAAGELYACGSEALAPIGTTGRVQLLVVVAAPFCAAKANSTGERAEISALGSVRLSDDDFVLRADDCPPGEPGIFMYGRSPAQLAFGDGFLCISPFDGGIHRLLPPLVIDGAGSAERSVDFGDLPNGGEILAGSTQHFQFWYRDPHGPGGTGFNLSPGLAVSFLP